MRNIRIVLVLQLLYPKANLNIDVMMMQNVTEVITLHPGGGVGI